MTESIRLAAYAAKQCARRVHNDHDPTISGLERVEASGAARQRMDAGVDFEDRIRSLLRIELGADCVDLTDEPWLERVSATERAVAAGVPVILGAAIPEDPIGRRRGLPDLLLRGADRADGSPGYLPGDVKHHRVSNASHHGGALFSSCREPGPLAAGEAASLSASGRYQFDDLIQLAHYYRMLQACGWESPGPPMAGVVGTQAEEDPEHFVLWRRLDVPLFTTYSRSQGTRIRSALERYDHEFGFRLKVADVAASRDGSLDQPDPLVRPVIISECGNCPWYDYCIDSVGPQDASANIVIYRLDTREWLALNRLGIETVDQLADLELDDDLLDKYWPEVTHQPKAAQRLATAIQRAKMRVAGLWFSRTSDGAIDIPRADVEVDFDIEWDPAEAIYLWGFVVNDRAKGTSRTVQFAEWSQMTPELSIAIAAEAISFMTSLANDCRAENRSFKVFHYAPVEVSNVRRFISEVDSADLPSVTEWNEFTSEYFCDMLPIVKANFFGVEGNGLKKIATYGAGFTWRDDDPGGEQSQDWLITARDCPDAAEQQAARTRLLEYNEDDVLATKATRDWLSGLG